MIIGINASSALKENPTGVEEYAYRLIKHLAVIPEARVHRFVLYFNPNLKSSRLKEFENLPENFQLKFLSFPFLWTQIRLAWEIASAGIDVLFIPVHILPFIHPIKSVVALHGLEYEYFPELYPFWHRLYLRWSTKYALKKSAKIIAVSESTKRGLIKLYGGNPDKISVIYHGCSHFLSLRGAETTKQSRDFCDKNGIAALPLVARNDKAAHFAIEGNYILYIGRVELKKNILGIVEAYNRLRKNNPHILNKLVLAGGEGFGFSKITRKIGQSPFKSDIILKGYVSEDEKNNLLENASLFLYPSFYEGFGMPVLEAQAAGVPVIASNVSSLPEVAGQGAILADPKNTLEISKAMKKILEDATAKNDLIQKGYQNIERFSWEKCARETLKVLIE